MKTRVAWCGHDYTVPDEFWAGRRRKRCDECVRRDRTLSDAQRDQLIAQRARVAAAARWGRGAPLAPRKARCGHVVPYHPGPPRKACDACTPIRKTRLPPQPKQCAGCPTVFTSKDKNARYCSIACSNRKYGPTCTKPDCNQSHRAKGLCSTHYNATFHPGSQKVWPSDPEVKRKRDLVRAKRRRAAVRGVEAEAVDRDVVGERDGWRCGICRRKVNRLRAYPDPMSPSLDHVVPLAERGPHTYANTRITHLVCNLRRQARGGGEQLALIG